MFVVSMPALWLKRIIVSVVIAGVVALGCIFAKISKSENGNVERLVSVNGADATSAEMKSFIASYGWEVSAEPDEVREVIIPAEFDDVYTNYNSIQLAQGFDLSPFKGVRVKRWTYTVTNYPGYESADNIKINILVYDNCVVGGDVCLVELNGFMHGFEKG